MIAIVPARGGSKGLPGKNIKDFCGKPLIYYTISETLKSKYITDIFLSTDSPEIEKIALKYGIKSPFLRPAELAEDNSKAIDTYIYTIDRLSKEYGCITENFIVLQPTSPLRTIEHIDNAIELFYKKNALSVISVCEFGHPITWAKRLDEDQRLFNFHQDEADNLNRQESAVAFRPNGAIFIFNYYHLKQTFSYYSDKTYAYLMQSEDSVDIDNLLDFEFAEFLMKKRNERNFQITD